MNVWIVNPYDNLPCEGYRPQRFWLMAGAFAAAGFSVTLWTSSFSHANKAPRVFKTPPVGDGFTLRLVPAPGYRRNISLRRILDHRRLAKNWREMAEASPRPDLVIVSSPPLSLTAAVREFCAAKKIPYIVDVMDAWPETFERVLPRWLLHLFGFYSLARRNYLGAAKVTAVADRYVELVRSYGYAGEVRKFYHGIELEGSTGINRLGNGVLRLVYIGNISRSYDLRTVIEAVGGSDGVELAIAGDGPDRGRLQKLAAGFENIRFTGYLAGEEMKKLLAEADAGVVPMWSDSCVGVPYKLADYAAAALPVLNSLEGETAALVDRYTAGFNYRAGDAASLVEAVGRLSRADRAELSRGAAAMARLFDASAIYRGYVDFALSAIA